MNGTMVASEAKAVPPVVSSVQDIPLENIRESNSNPRRVFDEAQLRELAAFVPGNKSRVMWRSPLCGVRLGLFRWVTGDYTRLWLYPSVFVGTNPADD